MSKYDAFTTTVRGTGTGLRYDYILYGPNGAYHEGTNGHACLKQAMYAATRGLTVPLRYDGMEDGSEPVHACKIKRGMPMADLHVHVHAVAKPKVGKCYGSKPVRGAA